MKGWSAVFVALAYSVAPDASPAQSLAPDLNSAARDLARRTAALAGRGEPVTAAWRDVSSLGLAAMAQARSAFEAGLRDAGGRVSEAGAPVEAHITLSENQTQYLLVEEVRKGEERQVWMAGWSRSAPPTANTGTSILLESRLLWEQPERMLDVALSGDSMLVLSGSSLARFARADGRWAPRGTLPLPAGVSLPRDPRGRLQWSDAVQANLPGLVCRGPVESMECRTSDEPWNIGWGRSQLLANLAAGRNFFDGRVATASGIRKAVPPFYSAAAADDAGRTVWLLATLDSGVQMFDESLNPIGTAGAWGSDLAGTDVRCGGRSVVLATRPGDGSGPDAIRAYAIVNRAVVPLGVPAELPGPVTALWRAPFGATAIVNAGGVYQAYAVTVTCGQ